RAAFIANNRGRPRLFGAPGRVNLIGEHTDYNDGFVLPVALDRLTVVAATPRGDRRVRARSVELCEEESFDLDQAGSGRRGVWLDYVEGMAGVLARTIPLIGADLVIASDLPIGGGLASSAALEISAGMALAAVAGKALPALEFVRVAQAAEHEFVGTRCGIMDQ